MKLTEKRALLVIRKQLYPPPGFIILPRINTPWIPMPVNRHQIVTALDRSKDKRFSGINDSLTRVSYHLYVSTTSQEFSEIYNTENTWDRNKTCCDPAET